MEWLRERNIERHARYGDATYLLEPNLKEGRGGLRDYHVMLWMVGAMHDIGGPKDLEYLGYLSHDEFERLSEALRYVGIVRNRLHYLNGRKCDELYFEHQIQLAKELGYKDKNGQQGVEQFLGRLHEEMGFIKRQHLMLLRKLEKSKKKAGRKKSAKRPLGYSVNLVEETLEFDSPEAIVKNPHILIKIFEKSAILGQPLAVSASRLVKEFLSLVDDDFRRSVMVVKSFQRILTAAPGSFNVLSEMLKTGMLTALIPELKAIVNLVQYDEYHVHPVDKHSLKTVQILKEMRDGSFENHETYFSRLFEEIEKPLVLLWAGLFHDVGKGQNGEARHPEEGAKVVRQVLKRMGYPDEDIDSVAFLVDRHLYLIHVATRRDLNDEKVIIECARQIKDGERLRMLYLLTIADSRATGPKAWNDWKAALLYELFAKVDRILSKGELATDVATKALEARRKEVLKYRGQMSAEELNNLFEQMSPRYLLNTPSADIRRHVALYEKRGDEPLAVDVRKPKNGDYRIVTVCAQDFPGLFSTLAGVFAMNSLGILTARIHTWRNHLALDVFRVTTPKDTLFEDEVWDRFRGHLQMVLRGELDLGRALQEKERFCQFNRDLPAVSPDEIIVDNKSSDFFTIIEIHTHDFPGLLYHITSTLLACKLDTWVAKIATKADQVVDVFYVRDFDGQKIVGPDQVDAIREAMQNTLASTCPDTKVRKVG
jgi:[protein-PII] uridylyltransferase